MERTQENLCEGLVEYKILESALVLTEHDNIGGMG
jgi:hypothetical protein